MANDNRPMGFTPVKNINGSPWNGRVHKFVIKAAITNAIGIGDPVIWNGGADTRGISDIDIATAGATNRITAIITGFEPLRSDLSSLYRSSGAKSVDRYCFGVWAQDAIFEIQDDGSAALSADSVGLDADIINTDTVNTTTGISGAELDATTPAANATYQMKIIGLADKEGNDLGINAVWEVVINLPSIANDIAGV